MTSSTSTSSSLPPRSDDQKAQFKRYWDGQVVIRFDPQPVGGIHGELIAWTTVTGLISDETAQFIVDALNNRSEK